MALQTLSLDNDAYLDYTLHEDQQQLVVDNRDLENIRIRGIKSIMIKNFKSFGGQHFVGPFTHFTAIIGPNGGGKSNVLDAIAFTMGLTVRDLRCSTQQELIYSSWQNNTRTAKKPKQEDEDSNTQVEILFHTNTPEFLRIKRNLDLNGYSQVFINDQYHTEEHFGQFLLQSKIHIIAKNFLLLQGEGDQLITLPTQQLTDLFERISGSIQYKKMCQDIQKNLSAVQLQVRDLQLNRSQLKTELKKLKELKQTSVQYRTITNEISELKVKIKLTSLYLLDQDLKTAKERLRDVEASQNNQQEDRHSIVLSIQKSDVSVKSFQKQLTILSKEQKQKEVQYEQLESQQKNSDQDQTFAQQQAETYKQNSNRLKNDLKTHENLIQELDLDISSKTKQLESIQQQNEMTIPEEYLAEYQQLQEQIRQDSFTLSSEVRKLQQQEQVIENLRQQSDNELRLVQGQLNELNSSYSISEGEFDQLTQQSQQTSQRLNQVIERLSSLDQQNKTQQLELKRFYEQRTEKEKIIQLYEIAIAEHIEEEESRRLVQQLASLFPKFMGELSGLMNPISVQWSNGMKLAFGQKLLCSLVVQDTQTAINLNKFLKTVGVVKDLIVLDRVKSYDKTQETELRVRVEKVVESYRNVKGKGNSRNGKAILAIDALEYDRQLDTVVSYLLRGTILTDSYQLSLEIHQAQIPGVYQVITQDGIQLQQGMLISNQKINQIRNFRQNNSKAQIDKKLNQDTITKAQKQLEDIQSQIRILKTTSIEPQLKDLSNQRLQLEEQQTSILIQIKYKEKVVKAQKEEQRSLQSKVESLKKELQQKQAQCDEVKNRLREVLKQLNGQSAKLYKEFSRKTGISEGQLMNVQDTESLLRNKDSLQQVIGKLMNEKQQQLMRIKQINKKINEMTYEVQMREQTNQSQKQVNSDLGRQIDELKDEMESLKQKELTLNQQLKQESKALKEFVEKRDKIMRKNVDVIQAINQFKQKIESLRSDIQKLLEDCEMESIDIELKIQDEESKDVNIDFKLISKDLDVDDPQSMIEDYNAKLKQKEHDSTKYLSENLQVHLLGGRGEEKYQKLENDIKELSERLNLLYDEETDIGNQLKTTKEKRKEKFLSLFKMVSEEINAIYRNLTFQEVTQLGGSALLYLENQQEPFNGGIIYTTTPPNKKYVFDNSEQLSGGEKTMSSLALQLAINNVIGAPFILLDEIDANLDPDNAMRLRMVLQALAGKPTQFIAVSHNIEVFGHAQSLVGVTIQSTKQTSEAFSLLLE